MLSAAFQDAKYLATFGRTVVVGGKRVTSCHYNPFENVTRFTLKDGTRWICSFEDGKRLWTVEESEILALVG